MVDSSSREELRARNNALRDQIDSMLETLHRQSDDLAAARASLAVATSVASSVDNLVRVKVNSTGIPIEVVVAPEAFSRVTPERLGQSITEAAQAAARTAQQRTRALMSPVIGANDAMPDLSDLVPGAPNLHDLLPPAIARGSIEHADDPADDDHNWGGSIMRDVHRG